MGWCKFEKAIWNKKKVRQRPFMESFRRDLVTLSIEKSSRNGGNNNLMFSHSKLSQIHFQNPKTPMVFKKATHYIASYRNASI